MHCISVIEGLPCASCSSVEDMSVWNSSREGCEMEEWQQILVREVAHML